MVERVRSLIYYGQYNDMAQLYFLIIDILEESYVDFEYQFRLQYIYANR